MLNVHFFTHNVGMLKRHHLAEASLVSMAAISCAPWRIIKLRIIAAHCFICMYICCPCGDVDQRACLRAHRPAGVTWRRASARGAQASPGKMAWRSSARAHGGIVGILDVGCGRRPMLAGDPPCWRVGEALSEGDRGGDSTTLGPSRRAPNDKLSAPWRRGGDARCGIGVSWRRIVRANARLSTSRSISSPNAHRQGRCFAESGIGLKHRAPCVSRQHQRNVSELSTVQAMAAARREGRGRGIAPRRHRPRHSPWLVENVRRSSW